MNGDLDLSIIIVSWNSEKWLRICLESIEKHTSDMKYEIIVVDNNSEDKSVKVALNDFDGIKVIQNKGNRGFAAAVNQGIEASSGRYLCLLNPDTKLVDRTMEQMLAFMDQNPQVGILGPHLMNEDGTTQPSVRRFPQLFDQLLIVLKLHHFFPDANSLFKYYYRDFNYRDAQSVDQVMGACMMIRRDVIKQIGILDEHFFIWFEEVDYCKRLKERTDYLVFYFPGAHLIHYGGDSFDKVSSKTKQKWYLKSLRYYFRRHKKYFAYLILLFFTPLSKLLGLFVARAEKTETGKEAIKQNKEKRKRQ